MKSPNNVRIIGLELTQPNNIEIQTPLEVSEVTNC